MRIRFQTARDVLLAFPTLVDDIDTKTDDTEPLAFMKRLAGSETPEDSLSFFAYLAPRREAVWWACRCLDALGPGEGERLAALTAAHAWVKAPEEDTRLAALRMAEAGDQGAAEIWAAYGAGWSGGDISNETQPPIAGAPQLTAKAVRASVLIAVSSAPFRDRRPRLEQCLDEALAVTNDDIETHF